MPKSNGGHRNGSPDNADTLTPTRLAEIGGSIPISQVQELRKIPSALPSLFPPSPVQGLAVTYPAITSIRLAWSAPANNGGSAVLGYKVSVVDAATGSPVYSSASYDTSPVTITGLTTGAALTASVFAVNAIGQSSGSSIAATPQTTTPDAPTGLAGTAGDTQAALSWTAPSSDGGAAITSYVIEYTPSGGSATTASTGTSTSFTLPGLTNGTAYSIRVAAVNSIGQGAYSTAVSVTPAIVPDAPTGLSATRGNAQVSLAWTAPASNGGAAITSYTITYSGGTVTTNSSATSATVTGLTNGTLYSFTVAATNSAGTGAASTSASATPATVPGAPTGLSGTAGDAQVPLTWTAPASNGGAEITGYVVEWTPSGGSASTVSTGSTSTSYTKTSLTNGTAVAFRVAAVNSVGTGTYSSSVSVTPAAPANLFSGFGKYSANYGGSIGTIQWPATWSSTSNSFTFAANPNNREYDVVFTLSGTSGSVTGTYPAPSYSNSYYIPRIRSYSNNGGDLDKDGWYNYGNYPSLPASLNAGSYWVNNPVNGTITLQFANSVLTSAKPRDIYTDYTQSTPAAQVSVSGLVTSFTVAPNALPGKVFFTVPAGSARSVTFTDTRVAYTHPISRHYIAISNTNRIYDLSEDRGIIRSVVNYSNAGWYLDNLGTYSSPYTGNSNSTSSSDYFKTKTMTLNPGDYIVDLRAGYDSTGYPGTGYTGTITIT